MAAFCIQPQLAAQLKMAAKAGEITMQKLFEMSSEERNALFGKYTDKETATQINAGFEKAMSSSQQQALNNWVKKNFTSRDAKSGRKADVISKINDLHKQGVLTPATEKAYLSDLVATKMGATITSEEAKIISEKAENLQQLQKDAGSIGDPTENPDAQIAYLKAQSDLSKYIASLTPASNLRVFLGTIGRGAMVTTLHSPLLNVTAHSVITLPEMFGRRVENRVFQGHSTSFWNQYIKNANKIFDKTGYDISRWEALGKEQTSMGEEYAHSQGSGAIRWMGRLVENTTFHYLHGILYQRFASFHFADSANLVSTAIAKAENYATLADEKARALEISKDAALIEPKTPMGRFVRAKAEADALYATFTNKSIVSETALGLRRLADNATGDFQVGQLTVPFAKVPANALSASLEYAGVHVTGNVLQGIAKTIGGVLGHEPFDKENFAGTQRMAIRAGVGFIFAAAIAQLIKPENFIGAWSTSKSEQNLQKEMDGVTNAIKVGNKWISLDYLANDGAALLSMLYATKYGTNSPADFAYQYSKGLGEYLANIPGAKEGFQTYQYLTTPPSKKDTADTASKTAEKYVLATITSRIVPGFISDIAKMTDQYNRATSKTSVTDTVAASIPGLREGLPISKDIFGTPQKTEPYLSTLLFGSRVKTTQDSQLLNEFVRLDNAGALPSITDVATGSKRMVELKQQIGGQQFDQAMYYFGTNLKQNWNDTINSDDYKNADSDTARQTMLNKVKLQTLKDTLDQYNYTPPEKP